MSKTTTAIPPEEVSIAENASSDLARLRKLITGLFLILVCCALYFAREFFMPVVLAFLIAMTLTPIVRFLRKRGVPSPLSATLLVLAFAGAIGLLAYMVSGPAISLVNDAPSIGRVLTERLRHLQRPMERINDIMHQFDTMTGQAADQTVEEVTVSQPGVISRAAGTVLAIGTTIGITLVLALFLLASGTMFYEKIVQSFGRMSDKKRALRVVYDVEREISRYLLTIALINAGLGAAIAMGLWVIGVPNAIVWGVLAALLNFLPYIGALMTMVLVAVISVVSFDSLSYAMLPPAYVLFCNIMEGQFLTPLILGRRLELNAVAIFIAVAFWSWLWGLVGALIAVPLLVVIKVFCDNFESLQSVGNFLAAQQTMEPAEETAPAAAIPGKPEAGPAVLDVVSSAQP
jgi:predicted PurR-regulated permease PerM